MQCLGSQWRRCIIYFVHLTNPVDTLRPSTTCRKFENHPFGKKDRMFRTKTVMIMINHHHLYSLLSSGFLMEEVTDRYQDVDVALVFPVLGPHRASLWACAGGEQSERRVPRAARRRQAGRAEAAGAGGGDVAPQDGPGQRSTGHTRAGAHLGPGHTGPGLRRAPRARTPLCPAGPQGRAAHS